MESNKFDALARRAVGDDSSRRGVLRAGIGALAASALAVVGLSTADDAAANDNAKKRRKRQHQRDQATRRRHRKIVICYNGETLEVLKNKVNQKFPNVQPGPCVCVGQTPITCGLGCCPVEFPACCPNGSFGNQPGESSGSTCAPVSTGCCPVGAGQGFCDAPNNQCCPPTNQNTRGYCAPPDAACCSTRTGGGFCPAPFNQCFHPT
ncbi:MAG: hypothetical protein KY456_13435, partial [Chloroflexi bacterium]|nr:hypothetical protein [Chloroflexota bacterium]